MCEVRNCPSRSSSTRHLPAAYLEQLGFDLEVFLEVALEDLTQRLMRTVLWIGEDYKARAHHILAYRATQRSGQLFVSIVAKIRTTATGVSGQRDQLKGTGARLRIADMGQHRGEQRVGHGCPDCFVGRPVDHGHEYSTSAGARVTYELQALVG
jgi:hypothetical protein